MLQQKADCKQGHLIASKKEQQQLQRELDTPKHVSRAKDHQITSLEESMKTLEQRVKENVHFHAELIAKDWQISMLEGLQAKHLKMPQQKATALPVQSFKDTGVQANYLAVAPGDLRGVEICGEEVLEVVGNKSQKLEWSSYGFYMKVADGALPPEVTASVAVKAILAGQFQLPKNSKLISAIYWVSASEVFLEKVAVNIQHCGVIRSEEECSKFKFIIAKCSQEELPYRFREKEGVFNPQTQYATIKLKRFSLVGVIAPEGTETFYTAFKFYRQIPNTVNANFIFLIVINCAPFHEYVKKEYKNWNQEMSQTIYFEDSAITLDLPDSPPIVADHWSIVPKSAPQITKAEVDQFKPKLEIPCCSLELRWTEGDEVKPLSHRVTLKGAKPPKNYFYISFYPQAVDSKFHTSQGGPSGNLGQPLDLTTLTCFKYKDEQGVQQRIHIMDDMAPRWRPVGRMLKFSEPDLENIDSTCRGDAVECCGKLLSNWLQGQNSNDSRSKTWETLLEVMRDARLGELANKLETILT